jgi:hypothetical protein
LCLTKPVIDFRPNFRIGENVAPRQQIILLKYKPSICARSINLASVEMHFTGAGRVKATNYAQERGLSTSGRSYERDELATLDSRGNIPQHFERAKAFRQADD